MMKGVTTIELTDVNTGEKQVYKEENMITNYFRDLIQMTESSPIMPSYRESWLGGSENTASSNANLESILKVLASGLVMFDGYLSDDADDYIFPSNVNMIGRGTYRQNSGKDRTLGSYNNATSTISEKGAKFVWDFNTDQSVGTIKSICLCPQTGSQIGFGHTTYNDLIDTCNSYYCFLSQPAYGLVRDKKVKYGKIDLSEIGYFKYLNRENNTLISSANRIYLNSTSFKLKIYNLPNRNICSITDNYVLSLKGEKIIQFPQEITDLLSTASTNTCYSIDLIDDKFIVVFGYYNYSIPVNGTIYYMEIDAKTLEVTTKTLNNTTGENLLVYNGDDKTVFATKNYILFLQGECIYLCNKETNEFKKVTLLDEVVKKLETYPYLDERVYRYHCLIVDDIFIAYPSFVNYPIMIDCSSGIMKKLSVNNNDSSHYYFLSTVSDEYQELQIFDKLFITSIAMGNTISLFPLVLFTKNNLSTPIVKTDQQSMKITYELILDDSTE